MLRSMALASDRVSPSLSTGVALMPRNAVRWRRRTPRAHICWFWLGTLSAVRMSLCGSSRMVSVWNDIITAWTTATALLAAWSVLASRLDSTKTKHGVPASTRGARSRVSMRAASGSVMSARVIGRRWYGNAPRCALSSSVHVSTSCGGTTHRVTSASRG